MTNGLTGTRQETVRLSPGTRHGADRSRGQVRPVPDTGRECVRVANPLNMPLQLVDDKHWELMVQPGLFAMELLLPMRGSVSG